MKYLEGRSAPKILALWWRSWAATATHGACVQHVPAARCPRVEGETGGAGGEETVQRRVEMVRVYLHILQYNMEISTTGITSLLSLENDKGTLCSIFNKSDSCPWHRATLPLVT